MMFGKNKIKVVLVKALGKENYEKIGETKAKIEDNLITWKNKSFPITEKCYFYINKSTPYVFIDYEKEKIITLHDKDIGINAQFLDRLISTSRRGIIGQLLYSLKLDMEVKTNWIKMLQPVTIFILGCIIGYLAGGGTV